MGLSTSFSLVHIPKPLLPPSLPLQVSPYNVFLKQTMNKSKEEGKQKSFAEIAEMWKQVPDDERKQWTAKADAINEQATKDRLALGEAGSCP